MKFKENLNKIVEKYEALGRSLETGIVSSDFVEKSREYSHLSSVVETINEYNKKLKEISDLEKLAKESNEDLQDSEIRNLALEELEMLKLELPNLEQRIKILLLPKDINDDKNAIIEIRAGTGGDEAALFTQDLLNMYQKYAERQKWKFEILSLQDIGIGGIKEVTALVSGAGVFAKLKFESGVHRVQRVPKTEVNGRIHTSAATVAVLPEMEEIDIKIDDKDLLIDTYRASGAGGQHVNTTDSAIRITHIPTGIVVTQQDQRSQHKNKAKAMKILLAKIYDSEYSKRQSEISNQRKIQIGSGDRSERIRTYNFPQGRVTDHRINLTLYKIEDIVNFGNLDEIISGLISDYEAKRLAGSEE